MSFPTQPTFVHHSDWDATSQSHPAMAFMEAYTHRFDEGFSVMGAELDKWHTSDFIVSPCDLVSVPAPAPLLYPSVGTLGEIADQDQASFFFVFPPLLVATSMKANPVFSNHAVRRGRRLHTRVQTAYAKLGETYGLLTAYHHEPYYLACHEAEPGKGDYVMIGLAHVYVNTPGQAAGTGVRDTKGREWEATLPGAFRFLYRKDEGGVGGYRLAKTEIFSDSGPVVKLLLKKKVVTVEQLGLA